MKKMLFFVTFDRNICDKQQDTVPLYIAKGLNFILNFYCCRYVELNLWVVTFELHIKFLLL